MDGGFAVGSASGSHTLIRMSTMPLRSFVALILVALLTVGLASIQAAEGSASAIAWTLPAGWSDAPAKPMRVAVFAVTAGTSAGECGLFVLPGGGDRLANVNRWRGQAGLAPIDAAALDKELTAGTCGFGPFSWLAVRGERKAFFAAMLPTPQGQCFVKLEAPPAQLDGFRDGFLAFCASLKPAAR